MPTGTLAPAGYQTLLDTNGDPVDGGLIWTQIAGTTTLIATYTDVNLTVPNTNPIVAEAGGRYTAYLSPGQAYKFTYEKAAVPPAHGAQITEIDNILAVPSSSVNLDVTGAAGEALAAGSAVYLSAGLGSKTAGLWYLADNSNSYSSSAAVSVGVVPATIASGASGSIRLAGIVPGFTALTIGGTYYVSTAGAVTTTIPLNGRIIGTADTTTTIVLSPNVPPASSYVTVTATGSQNNYAPGLSGNTIIRCNNASLLTITGLAGGVNGQEVTFEAINGQVDFVNASGSSSTGNKLINYVSSGNTSIVAGNGSGYAKFIYDAASQVWRLAGHDQGAYITPTFAGGNYTANGSMTWTVASGDAVTWAYYLRGRQLAIEFSLNTTTVGGTVNTTLLGVIPGGYTSAKQTTAMCEGYDNAIGAAGVSTVAFVAAAGTQINFFKLATGNWTLSTDNTLIRGQLAIEVT